MEPHSRVQCGAMDFQHYFRHRLRQHSERGHLPLRYPRTGASGRQYQRQSRTVKARQICKDQRRNSGALARPARSPRLSARLMRLAVRTAAGETLTYAGLELGVAHRRRQRLCRYAASVMLPAATINARIRARVSTLRAAEDDEASESQCSRPFDQQRELRHLPPPHPGRGGRVNGGHFARRP